MHAISHHRITEYPAVMTNGDIVSDNGRAGQRPLGSIDKFGRSKPALGQQSEVAPRGAMDAHAGGQRNEQTWAEIARR